ncbi:MAG: hypothetical protein M1839_001531 [Geoglossum umbratile]|nr:MAG: hypothetical protein M1839_001531 [Geoglossum umbratile]
MSRVSISKSYAVLVGLEMYTRTRRKARSVYQSANKQKEKALHPKAVAEEEEQKKDGSQSAGKERRFLEKQKEEKAAQQDEAMRDENVSVLKVLQKLRIQPQTPQHGTPHPKVPTEGRDDDMKGRRGSGSATPPLSSLEPS